MHYRIKKILRVTRQWKNKYFRREEDRREEDRLEEMVGPPGVWNESRDFQIDFLTRMGLQPQHKVLDIGCGPLRGGIPLIRYLDQNNYTGIDIRPQVIKEAHQQIIKAKLSGKNPSILATNSFGRNELPKEKYDFIWCFQVLYHLDDELLDACLQQISRFLKPGAACYTNVNTNIDEGSWKEFPFVKRPIDLYNSLSEKHFMRIKNLGQLREHGYTQKVSGQFNHMLELRTNVKDG